MLWYSQTGQLRRAAESVVRPLERAGAEVVWRELRPRRPYPFPWPMRGFLDVFPESVAGPGPELEPLDAGADEAFDLVLLCYQVWFLSPSTPVRSLLDSPQARALLGGRPVVTLVACRNMWYSAAADVRDGLRRAGARHVGSIVATDDGPAWATFVTTPRWLLTGRRDRFLRVLPPAGISDAAIADLERFGVALRERLAGRDGGGELFAGLGAVPREVPIAIADLLGKRAFRVWARPIARLTRPGGRPRVAATAAFGAWLTLTVPLVVPLLTLASLPLARWSGRLVDRHLASVAPGAELAPLPPAAEAGRAAA